MHRDAFALPRQILDGLAPRIGRADHHVHRDIGAIERKEGFERKFRQARPVGSAEIDQDAPDRLGARPCRFVQFPIARLQECEFRTKQAPRMPRRQPVITMFVACDEILVEQDVAVVDPVGKIVDRHQARGRRANRALPVRAQPVVVHNHPIGRKTHAGERGERIPRIVDLACGGRDHFDGKAIAFDPPGEMSLQRAAQEQDLAAPGPQHGGERQAAHDMSGADDNRCVRAEGYLHARASGRRERCNASARFQSSSVSMSTTRHSGRTMVLALPWTLKPSSHASRRPQ